jgi:ribonucleoside-diphosphate reductase alpha chain
VKNRYIERILESHNLNTENVWLDIINSNGSIQHMDCFSDEEKMVFKTAFELDQTWIVRHAADRAPLIDQAASNNLFFPPDVDKKELLNAHFMAWELGVKSLYYCRSRSMKTAHAVSNKVERVRIIDNPKVQLLDNIIEEISSDTNDDDYFVCEACQ